MKNSTRHSGVNKKYFSCTPPLSKNENRAFQTSFANLDLMIYSRSKLSSEMVNCSDKGLYKTEFNSRHIFKIILISYPNKAHFHDMINI